MAAHREQIEDRLGAIESNYQRKLESREKEFSEEMDRVKLLVREIKNSNRGAPSVVNSSTHYPFSANHPVSQSPVGAPLSGLINSSIR